MKRAETASVRHARKFIFKRWDSFRESRRHIAIWVLSIGMVIGATGLQFWWYQDNYRTSAQAIDGTYAEAVLGSVETLNPIFAQSSAEQSAGELIFSRLLTYDDSGNLNYDLAEDMQISEDEKTYTITIRADARWSDATYVRARDVAYTVGLLQNTNTHSTLTGWEGVEVKVVNERTVSFTLPAVYAPFPHALRFLPILPEHVLRDIDPSRLQESSFSKTPVGSGPYVARLVQDVNANEGRKIIYLARNEHYFKGDAKLSRIQLHVYKDTDAIKRALATSEVNAASDLPVSATADVNQSRYSVDKHAVNSGVYALFNTTSPILQDVKVRQALQAATDTVAVRSAISNDLPELYAPIIPKQIDAELPAAPAHDITRALTLLDEAGWKLENGVRTKDGQQLTLNIVTTKNPDFEKALTQLSAQWRQLGIAITTNIVDPSDQSQNVTQTILQPRQYDVLLQQLVIGGDPDVYAYWHSSQASSGRNYSNYKSAAADDALVSARARVDPALRDAKYVTFVKQWLADAPAVGLYQATSQYVHTKTVNTVPVNAEYVSAVDRFSNVLYWTVGERRVFTTP